MAIETRTINGTLTEAYTSVEGSYMTQAKATHFHDFWTRKILAPTESVSDFLEVTAAERAKLEAAESINYTIENSTKSLTLILHADAYARVTDEMFEAAAAKNITITSA